MKHIVTVKASYREREFFIVGYYKKKGNQEAEEEFNFIMNQIHE